MKNWDPTHRLDFLVGCRRQLVLKKTVVGKAVIRQAFIRQMPPSVPAHLAIQPDSVLLESLAMLADCAVAAKKT